MAWTPLLLALLSHCTGSLSQPVLTQPPSLSASPGDTARLTCTLSSDVSVGGKYIYWFQQKPGSPPRYLLYYNTDSDKGQGSGVPSRFSGSKDASANAGLLTISGLQPEDEAEYYCMISHSSGSHSDTHRWGRGPERPTEPVVPSGLHTVLVQSRSLISMSPTRASSLPVGATVAPPGGSMIRGELGSPKPQRRKELGSGRGAAPQNGLGFEARIATPRRHTATPQGVAPPAEPSGNDKSGH
ncbi:PREDICTED: immunoglobulin omega chain [Myotis davidii]|uniref:immunoglobulin omega chain n=1 Tax=Myotis davidii TaxID=225400 RepID=UPI0003EBC56D|nr:PREDICTED: immunoglobulin omega chain [Myotis davidii]